MPHRIGRQAATRRTCGIATSWLFFALSIILGGLEPAARHTARLEAQVTRDSAGIRIIDNPRPLLPASRAWRLDTRPLVDLGEVGGDSLYEFNLVMGVAKMTDGRIAVANQGSNTIRFFDASGRYVGHAGRKGQGPGEFQQILKMWRLAGDTLALTDLHEIEYFTGDGKHIRRGAAMQPGLVHIYPAVFLSPDVYLGIDWNDFDRNAPPDLKIRDLELVRVADDGATQETLGRFPAMIGSPMHGVTFAPRAHVAATGMTIWYAFGARYEILRLAANGRVEAIVRRPLAPRPITDAMKQEYRQFVLNGTGEDGRPWPASMRPRLEASVARARYPDHLPTTSTIREDRDGNLWVRIYDYREGLIPSGPVRTLTIRAPSQWDVFNRQGGWLCSVDMPSSFTPLEIGSDYIAGLWRDADDVEHVRLYRLVKPAGR